MAYEFQAIFQPVKGFVDKAGDETCNHLRFFNYIHEGSDWLGNNIAECATAKTLNKTSVNLIKIFNLFSPSQDVARCGVL